MYFIHNYFLCNFNLKLFLLENEYLIRDTYIKRYVKTSSSITLLPDIFDLLCSKNFDIEDDNYSKEKDEIKKESLIKKGIIFACMPFVFIIFSLIGVVIIQAVKALIGQNF